MNMTAKNVLTTKQRRGITIGAAIALGIHVFSPFKFDGPAIALVGIAIFPWVIHLVRSIKHNDTEVQLGQDTTDEPPPPNPAAKANAEDPFASAPALKILATLHRYQLIHCPGPGNGRWTFTVSPQSPEYPDYLLGLSQTVRTGLVTVSLDNNHCMLTSEGLVRCAERANDIKNIEPYRF